MTQLDLSREKAFFEGLSRLNRASLAHLRRSLGSEHYQAYFLEREIFASGLVYYPSRILYLVAGLYALVERPHRDSTETQSEDTAGKSFATLLGELSRRQTMNSTDKTNPHKITSTEKRFLALLDSDVDGLPYHLRQSVMLLNGQRVRPDWALLLRDVSRWHLPERGDQVRQRWAKDFYRAISIADEELDDEAETTIQAAL